MTEEEIIKIKNIIDRDKDLTISDLKNIKEYINSKIDTLSGKLCDLPIDDKKYDISFLKSYLDIIGISVNEFAKSLDITKAYAYKLLNGDVLVSAKQLVKILILFNVRTYEELVMLVEENIDKFQTTNNEYNLDINKLKEFLSENKITNVTFADYLGIKKAHLYRLFNEQVEIKPKYLNKIFTLLNSEELIKNLSCKRYKKIKNNPAYDISFLKNYLNDNNITQTELAKYLGVSRQYIFMLLNGQRSANQTHLNKLFIFFNVESIEQLYELVNNNNQLKKIKL